MNPELKSDVNVMAIVPFLGVTSMERSVRFYVEGLGFEMKRKWEPGGKLRWCWLTLGPAALMLQEFAGDEHHAGAPEGKLGKGMSLCFTCRDAIAIYRDAAARGLDPTEPQVGNAMWVTGLTDPDGYRLFFESPTDVPEETILSQWQS